MAVFQAAAAGLPIIATRIRATADYLREPDNCLWVEPHNPEMLAEKILILLDNPALAERMSRNNRQIVKQFSADRVASEYIDIYSRILADNT